MFHSVEVGAGYCNRASFSEISFRVNLFNYEMKQSGFNSFRMYDPKLSKSLLHLCNYNQLTFSTQPATSFWPKIVHCIET